jgi:hypothetical protein
MEAKGRDVDFLEDPEAELQLASDFQHTKSFIPLASLDIIIF